MPTAPAHALSPAASSTLTSLVSGDVGPIRARARSDVDGAITTLAAYLETRYRGREVADEQPAQRAGAASPDDPEFSALHVSLFIGCFNDTLFPDTGRAVLVVLERLGHTVDFPLAQTCCGQMHNNSGYGADATALMRRHLDVFEDAETIVCPSSSCVVTVRQAYPRLAAATGEAALVARAEALAARTFEFAEFLVKRLGVEDVDAYYPHRVTYHSTCNSLRGLGLGDAALRLLRNVRGLELVALPGAEECCGFGGTFAVKNAETSIAMLTDKLSAIRTTGAEVCTAVDNSCLMHIAGGLSRERSGRRALHLAEILNSVEGNMAP